MPENGGRFCAKFVILLQIYYKMKVYSLVLMAAAIILAACGGKMPPGEMKGDSTEVSFSDEDSVLLGYAGSECTDTILDFIQPGKDPMHYTILRARAAGDMIGNFDTGDRVAIVLGEHKKRVLRAIDISSLIGKWLTGDSINDPEASGFTLGEDGYASTNSRKMEKLRYSAWDIRNAKLVLTKCDPIVDNPKLYYDTFHIVSLVEDTLVLRPESGKESIRYVKVIQKILAPDKKADKTPEPTEKKPE